VAHLSVLTSDSSFAWSWFLL